MGFGHNHEECIKEVERSLMIEFPYDFSNASAEPMSPPTRTPPPPSSLLKKLWAWGRAVKE
ncbi:hypothetical protein COLO4_19717 [Corchorus olitorius]|uniref:Uncharacterized protein n=1 Tax=Corchorus olitorius TaxID=93759 RepID=A0A1R3J3Y1_9ROSI|nr:hypothetical protein COLO4_19717 [Corchorus olitorius]